MIIICFSIMFSCIGLLCAALLYVSARRKKDLVYILELLKMIVSMIEIMDKTAKTICIINDEIAELKERVKSCQ